MDSDSFVFFKRAKELDNLVLDFFKNLNQASFTYIDSINAYLKNKKEFIVFKEEVCDLEHQNDILRRQVERKMYQQMLLPDMRGDVLKILENTDKILNKYESNLISMDIEKIKIPSFLKKELPEFLKLNQECVLTLIKALKNFFKGLESQEEIDQVLLQEHQIDLKAENLKKTIFQEKLTLAHQLQLKEFVYAIENVSDIAENIADLLTIITIKHSL